MEMQTPPLPNPPRPEVAKATSSPATQSISSIVSILTKPKDSLKTPKSVITKAPAQSEDSAKKKKGKDKNKKQKKIAKPAFTPLPPVPLPVEESSREDLGLSDREERAIPSAQALQGITSVSPNSGRFGADAPSSPAVANSSPPSSGWADIDPESDQELAQGAQRKRLEKSKHTSLYQGYDHGDQHYHTEGPTQYGYSYFDR